MKNENVDTLDRKAAYLQAGKCNIFYRFSLRYSKISYVWQRENMKMDKIIL